MAKCLRFMGLISLLIWAAAAYSTDLLQAYQWAKNNDLQYKAAQSRFEADVLNKQLGLSRSLPQLSFSHRWMRNDYRSNHASLDWSDDAMERLQQCTGVVAANQLDCVIQGITSLEVSDTKSRYTSNESNLTLTQVIYDPEISSERATGRALAVKAIAEMAMAEKSLIMRVLEAYLEVLRAADDSKLAEQQLQSISEQQQFIQQRFELGIAKETDVYEAQAAFDAQSLAYAAMRTRYTIALYRLSQITGETIEAVQPLSGHMQVEPLADTDMQAWVNQALARNDAIQVAEALERVAHHEAKKHKLNRLPRVMAAANYNERDLKGGQGFQPASTSTAFGVEVRLPLYHGGALHHAKKQASYKALEAQDSLALQREQIETAVVSSLLMMNNEIERFYSKQRAAESASRSLAITQRAYEEGGSSLLDLFQVQKNYYESRAQLSHARYDYVQRLFELKQLSGSLSKEDVVALNQWFEQP